MKNLALPIVTVLLLAACASTDRNEAVTAVATPLHDLNLVKPEIPDILRKAERGTFVAPADGSCATVHAEINALDSALGHNGDEADSEGGKPSLLTRGKEEASKAAVKAIQNTAEEVVPFRKWVRKLTGAERRSKDLADAVAAGYARRSFLRGYAAAKSCSQPIVATSAPAPMPTPAPADKYSSASMQTAALPALDWLAGHWCLQQAERKTEELWLPTQGDIQLGLSREIKAGSTLAFEFIRIATVDGALTYLAQPNGREATAFRQVAGGDNWIRFENPRHDFPTRIEYRRNGEALTATISGPGKTGTEEQIAYPYQRCGD